MQKQSDKQWPKTPLYIRRVGYGLWGMMLAYALFFVPATQGLLGMSGVLSAICFLWGVVALAACNLSILHFVATGGLPHSMKRRRRDAHNPEARLAGNSSVFHHIIGAPLLTQSMILAGGAMAAFSPTVLYALIVPATPFALLIWADILESCQLERSIEIR